MNTTAFHSLTDLKEMIEKKLEEIIPMPQSSPHASLFEAARYSVLCGGKRIRPLFTLSLAEALSVPVDYALAPACALELIHTYSLIHDDLPCMDDDDLRRGKATLHKVYNEAHALLTGDFLLTKGFEVLCMAPHLRSEMKVELLSLLTQRSGGDGMIGGQVVDMIYEEKKCDFTLLSFIHHNKTAALISCAMEFAAILAGCDAKTKELIRSMGYEIGLSFQIQDDILDITSNEKTLGKPIHSDLHNQKNTAVSVLGMEKACDVALSLMQSVQKKRENLSLIPSSFDEMIISLKDRSF